MSHHTFVYTGAVGLVANTALTPVQDAILPQDNAGNYLPQIDLMLIMAAALSATADRARLLSPAYRQVSLPYVVPVQRVSANYSNPNVLDLVGNPMRIPKLNPLGADFTSDIGAGTEQCWVVCLGQDQKVQAPIGDTYTLRATGTTTLVPNTWTPVALTFDQPVIQGLYSIVGAWAVSANGVAFRLTVDNQFVRPGGLMQVAPGQRPYVTQLYGGFGEWGRFQNTSLPRLEVLSAAADTTETLFLQVVKVG